MNSNPNVSAVIIFYNAEQFLGDAIESVLAQSYDDWELLLVNDGSSNRATRIAREYATKYPARFRCIQHENGVNRGMSASRNLGIRHARGRYLAFLDADDVWYPETLARQVALMEAHPSAAIVYGPIEWWYSWSGSINQSGMDYIEQLGVPAESLIQPPRLVPRFLQNKAAVPSGMLVRQEVIRQVGGFEDEFRGEYEDQVFCAKVCLQYPVFASGQCWYRYRQHSGSAVSTGIRSGQSEKARAVFLKWLTSYLFSQRVLDPGVWRTVVAESLRLRQPRLYHGLQSAARLVGE